MASRSTSFEHELIQFIRSKEGTQQYPYPSHVNPSGIVSMRLAGKNTYNRWQEQMECLIESHGMKGFIDGSFRNPKQNCDDDSQNTPTEGETLRLHEEWKRSDSLVKGWIFCSLSKRVMSRVVGLPTAMDVWNKLKTTYGPLTGTEKYPYPSHVQPSKFVSMKLSGEHNYCRWQEKMARLIERHGMLGFIDGTFKNPKDMNDDSRNADEFYEEWKTSDSLVKGWIFGSLNEDVMRSVVGLHTAIDVWKKLNTTYGTSSQGTSQQCPYPSHVRPNDFVSTRLTGQNNYNLWREQMVCLIESHGMQGFINGKFKNPEDVEGERTTKYEEWKRSDSLVKGWIFGSLSENVMGNVVGLPTAMSVWDKLSNTFNALITTTTTTTTTTTDNEETQQYPYPSHVEPSHFVSIKLSGEENYNEWREQMLCLLESHDMQGFYDGTFKTPQEATKYEEWKRSDSLVKRWILCSLTENIKGIVVGIPIAMLVREKLQITFAAPSRTSIDNNAGTQHYPYPSHVQKPNGFVSINLSGQNDYCGWQEQMVRLIEINDLQGFIDGRFKKPEEMNGDSQNIVESIRYKEWKRSDSLVKGLIFGSLSEHVMDTVVGLTTAMDVWTKLNITYGRRQYPYPSHVQLNDFVTIKLSGENNYDRWREQMICLIESHGMLGFINSGECNTYPYHSYEELERSDALVRGWIIGSLSEKVKGEVDLRASSSFLWKYLDYANRALTAIDDLGLAEHISLHRAIMQGDGLTVREYFNMNNDVFTVKLNRRCDTPLHVAIETNANVSFLMNLLNEIHPESLPIIADYYGFTAMHRAAWVGNLDAAKMLLEKNPILLFVPDQDKILPLFYAVRRPQSKKTFEYLLQASKQHINLSMGQPERYLSPFEGLCGALLLDALIDEGNLDVAYNLIMEYPNMATFGCPLERLAGKMDLYYCGTQYNFYQRFLYTHMPIDNIVGGGTNHVQDIENQETLISRCWRSCFRIGFQPFIQMIYVKFWEITLLHVSHIKRLKEEKEKHTTALTLLKFICEEVGEFERYRDIEEQLYLATNAAAVNNVSDALKEIVMHFPQAYYLTCHPSNDSNMIQLAIKNRSEKVYNLLVHDFYTRMLNIGVVEDKDGNNFLHLAGELAPIEKLNVVSGAALQMQRELQWFKEVEGIVQLNQKEGKNKKQETPFMIFRRDHSKLRKEGEEWLKKTADSYTITAALIITIVFAAAITIPGGNNDDTGKAVFATKASFTLFAVADAISLFTSTTSLLLFLSILTARYRDEDFLYRLPKRLILGLVMLFLSVTSLMVAFSATLYLTFGQEKAWILIPIAALTCLPITSFVTLQFPLLVELISSTYGRRIFGKSK